MLLLSNPRLSRVTSHDLRFSRRTATIRPHFSSIFIIYINLLTRRNSKDPRGSMSLHTVHSPTILCEFTSPQTIMIRVQNHANPSVSAFNERDFGLDTSSDFIMTSISLEMTFLRHMFRSSIFRQNFNRFFGPIRRG